MESRTLDGRIQELVYAPLCTDGNGGRLHLPRPVKATRTAIAARERRVRNRTAGAYKRFEPGWS